MKKLIPFVLLVAACTEHGGDLAAAAPSFAGFSKAVNQVNLNRPMGDAPLGAHLLNVSDQAVRAKSLALDYAEALPGVTVLLAFAGSFSSELVPAVLFLQRETLISITEPSATQLSTQLTASCSTCKGSLRVPGAATDAEAVAILGDFVAEQLATVCSKVITDRATKGELSRSVAAAIENTATRGNGPGIGATFNRKAAAQAIELAANGVCN